MTAATMMDVPAPVARQMQLLRIQRDAAYDAIERLIVERDAALAKLDELGEVGDLTDELEEERSP